MILLTTLALADRQQVTRELLLDALWPTSTDDLASQALRSLVRDVHKRLRREHVTTPLIVHEDGHYRLNHAAGIGVDINIFDALADEGDWHLRANEQVLAITSFERAIQVYRGDLCAGSNIQATLERERLRSSYLTLLAHVADYYFKVTDYAVSLRYSQLLLTHDPCREEAHRMAMRCYMRSGERSQALHQYRLCLHALRAEFDADPEPATIALFDQVRTNPGAV